MYNVHPSYCSNLDLIRASFSLCDTKYSGIGVSMFCHYCDICCMFMPVYNSPNLPYIPDEVCLMVKHHNPLYQTNSPPTVLHTALSLATPLPHTATI